MDNQNETRAGQTAKTGRNRRGLLLLALVSVALAGTGVGTYFLWWGKKPKPELPGPDSPEYQEYVEEFQIGVAALDAANYDLALERLTRAIEKVPEEPAGWANRGLVHLRENRLKEAAADLKQAHERASD